ncbi:hypothetical protein COB55_02190 [Candidatus Wolfebacteria bacterium]|nr:MAG: hypothetical protein COB55_02190 [Candidatus Wolfebacteria bacterium]
MNKNSKVLLILIIILIVGVFLHKNTDTFSSLSQNEAAMGSNYERVEVADGVYSFGNGFTFSMFVVTTNGVVVVDPINQGHAELLLASIRGVTDLPIKYLVYSHNHWDHVSGGQVFKDVGATILSHRDARNWLLDHPNPAVIIPDEVWSGSFYDLTLGGTTIELLNFGRSHGSGMTVTYLPKEKVVFLVDIVTPKRVAFTIMPDFWPSDWVRTLGEVEKLDFDIAMFSHKTAQGTKADVVEVREYLEDLRAELFSMMQRGDDFFTLAENVDLPKYKDWEFYDEWLPMNAWRILMEVGIGW